MSNNYFNYDLLFSVEQGKKLTQEQFIKNYESMMAARSGENVSIFGTNISGFVGEMFQILNTNKAKDDEIEELDANEIAALRAFVDDGDNNEVVSDGDMDALLKKVIDKINEKYKNVDTSSPEKMFQQALQNANGDMRNSFYVQDLNSDMSVLESMKSLRQSRSDADINQFQSEIDNLIMKSTKLSAEFKEEYAATKLEVDKLQKETKEAQARIEANQKFIDEYNLEQEHIERQLTAMSDDEKEDNSDLVDTRNGEFSNFQSKIDSLTKENNKLSSDYLKSSNKLKKAEKHLSKLTKDAQLKDSDIKSKISELQARISGEKRSCENDIANYDNRIQNLRAARQYAVQNIAYSASSDGQNAVSHQNDNAISFDELQNQGLKYSSDKGRALAADVYNHRVGFIGYCAKYVADGLQRTGLGRERANATDMDNKLVNNNNFRQVKITSKDQLRSLPAGCIVVYEAGAAGYHSKYGHIEVTMGDGTAVSDGVTRNMRYSENMTVFVPVEAA